MKLSCYFLSVSLLSCCLLSPHAPAAPEQLLPAEKAQGAALHGGGKEKGTTGDAKLPFGHGTSWAPLPVHELQVFLLEAAVLLAISSSVLLQLRHPLLQKDYLCDGRGEDQPPMLKPAGKVAPSARATPTTSSTPCRCSLLASELPRFVALIQSRSPRHSSWHYLRPALHCTRQPELREPSLGLAPGRATYK